MINGILNVYKEKGYTSHDVVAKLRGICKQKKIGHTGTLDPDAVGVLPVCLGSATKLCDMMTDKKKEYEAEFLLGITTDTQDISGTVLEERKVLVSEREVRQTVLSFLGTYQQIPPMYSAIKINGRRLYELARQGIEIERNAREVKIAEIEIKEIALPRLCIRVVCSKGTYIRTLGYDIGEKLGCGAVMTMLTRTKSGEFTIADALTLSELEALRDQNKLTDAVIQTEHFFADYPSARVKKEYRKYIDNGNKLLCGQLFSEKSVWKEQDKVRIYNDEAHFCGVYEYCADNCFKPFKLFF